MRKDKELQEDEKDRGARIFASRNKGMQNCQPSSGATAFPSVMFRTGRGGGSRASVHYRGGSTGTGGIGPATPGSDSNESDDSTPASNQSINQLAIQDSQRRRGVISLRRELQDALVASGGFLEDYYNYQTKTGASEADLTRFFEDGWFGEELTPDMALNIMKLFIYNLGSTVPGGESSFNRSLEMVKETGSREDNGKDTVIWSQLEFVGIPEASLLTLCTHYDADLDHLRFVTTASAFKLYTEGWPCSCCSVKISILRATTGTVMATMRTARATIKAETTTGTVAKVRGVCPSPAGRPVGRSTGPAKIPSPAKSALWHTRRSRIRKPVGPTRPNTTGRRSIHLGDNGLGGSRR